MRRGRRKWNAKARGERVEGGNIEWKRGERPNLIRLKPSECRMFAFPYCAEELEQPEPGSEKQRSGALHLYLWRHKFGGRNRHRARCHARPVLGVKPVLAEQEIQPGQRAARCRAAVVSSLRRAQAASVRRAAQAASEGRIGAEAALAAARWKCE